MKLLRWLCLPFFLLAFAPTEPFYQDIYRVETDRYVGIGNRVTEVKIDRKTGAWQSWVADGSEGDFLTSDRSAGAVAPALDVSVNGTYLIAKHGATLLRHDWAIDPDRRGATLNVTLGILPDGGAYQYELTGTYRLLAGQKRVERSATLVRNKPGNKEHLNGFRFQVPGVAVGPRSECALTVPGPFFTNTFVRPGTPLDSLKSKTINFHSAPDAGFGLLLVSNKTRKLTLASFMSTGGEVSYGSAVVGNGQTVTLRHDDRRAYYLHPGQRVTSDTQILDVSETPETGMAAYQQMATATLPLDTKTPADVADEVILEVYPKYFNGGLKEIERRLPFYKNVGFTMVYLMPHWLGGYSPIDPYALDPKFGTKQDLRQLVQTAHRLGLKVIFDMVIHGFNRASPLTKQRPVLFVKNEGDTLAYHPTWGSVTTDWASPAYQQYMVDLVLHDQREYGIDGYRVDAATYKGAGWNPNVPYPAYRDGSAAPELMRAMLTALRQKNPRAVLLSEVFGPVFYTVCNFGHDNQTEAVPLLLEKLARGQYSAEDYKQHVAGVYATLPRGINRVFYARNHDTDWFYEFGGYTPMFMAFEAVHALFGIPEVFAGDPDYKYKPDDDPATYRKYKNLFTFRKTHPEFRRGNVAFSEIQSDNPDIFSGLRMLGGAPGRQTRSVALVSFSQKPGTALITVAGNVAKAPVLTDVYTGKPVQTQRVRNDTFRITLQPGQAVAGLL